jgi:DNA-binding beta-propeller fold protein YncE/mono/diheme cytochrome c family protein
MSIVLLSFACALSGCDGSNGRPGAGGMDTPGATPSGNPNEAPAQAGSGAIPGGHAATDPAAPAAPALPTDARPAVVAETPPPAISGGTLLVTPDGLTAIVADPDRDRISIVGLGKDGAVQHIALQAGDEPGRLAQDMEGRVHVALRGTGEVLSLDLASAEVITRRAVCDGPRGIAYDAAADALHVACITGDLVTLPASGGEVLRRVRVAADLRDVVVQDGRLLVTQFKEAKLLQLDAQGEATDEYGPSAVRQHVLLGQTQASHPFEPVLARRAIALRNGQTLVLHQRAMADEIDIGDPHDAVADGVEPPVDDEGAPPVPTDPTVPTGTPGGEGGYGSGANCQSIVQSAVSMVDAEGKVLQSASLGGSVLPVDVAASPDGAMIAVANAGLRDPNAPLRGFGPDGAFGPPPMGFRGGPLPPGFNFPGAFGAVASGSISIVMTDSNTFHDGEDLGVSCVPNTMPVPGQPTAVAFTNDGTIVVQSREPAQLILVSSNASRAIDLGGESRLDTGHELFHRDAGGGLACASCHGEGGDDGHVWQFAKLGARRTQAINVGLRGTEPFHWSGDMKDLPTLMGEVFVSRMGGVPQSSDRVDALANWMFALRPPAGPRPADDPAVQRGEELFHSEAVACGSCHAGEQLTNNKSEDVGTGGLFQVPSLVGIAYRAPFIHTGCAATLRDRFDPACGGDRHGNVADLDEAQLDDLVAYLESL